MNFGYFRQTLFFSAKRDNFTALFQTYNWEKSIFFNALVRVFAEIYANTVLIGLTNTFPRLIYNRHDSHPDLIAFSAVSSLSAPLAASLVSTH